MDYCIIDIETTGGHSRGEKITEIAIYRHNGEKVVEEFVSLINPEKRIPYNITMLTGITNEMVEDAPKFYEVAKRIVEITQDSIFVAHNSRFDYNFVREEFKRLGYDYSRETLCTVKLSRTLIPGMESYSLGKLCRQLSIDITARHRAAGDALATVRLFELLLTRDKLDLIRKNLIKNRGYNSPIREEQVRALPDKTGVYYFHNADGDIIYIGKSLDIRSRIASHLNNYDTQKGVELMQAAHSISFELTGSELVALLLESDEIKKHKPLYNRAQRRALYPVGVYSSVNEQGYVTLQTASTAKKQSPVMLYANKTAAHYSLTTICERYDLCPGLAELYTCTKGCLHYSMKGCKGAALGHESPEDYNQKVEKLLERHRLPGENLLIVDEGRNPEEHSVVLVENGCYQGFGFFSKHETLFSPDQVKIYIDYRPATRDTQTIIEAYIRKGKMQKMIAF